MRHKFPKEIIKKYIPISSYKLPREYLQAALPALFYVLIGIFIIYKYVDPEPPKRVVMSISMEESNYKAYASIYQELLKNYGIELELNPSKGVIEDIRRLKSNDPTQMALIQDGAGSAEGSQNLVSLGSLYYEAIWIICRCEKEVNHLQVLKGKKIAVGSDMSGTKTLAMALLGSSGISTENTKIFSIGNKEAADALRSGEVDVAIFVDMPDSPLIHDLLKEPSLRLANLDQAEGYAKRFPYLSHLTLSEGSLDIANNIPKNDVHMLASTTMLIVRDDLHPAIVNLMLRQLTIVHSGPSILNDKNRFPTDLDDSFPLSIQAESYYKEGLPFLDKYLPFWMSTFVSRLVLLLPLLALLIPIIKTIPEIYTWLVNRKIMGYYGELHFLEMQIEGNHEEQMISKYGEELNAIDRKVNMLQLPNSFTQHVYELKGNVDLVRSKLDRLSRSAINKV